MALIKVNYVQMAQLMTTGYDALPLDDNDWGSERQIDAENAFVDLLTEIAGDNWVEEWIASTLKHNTYEAIADAVRCFVVEA